MKPESGFSSQSFDGGRRRPMLTGTLRCEWSAEGFGAAPETAASAAEPWPCTQTLGHNYLAIVNPAAGGGRSRKLLGPALDRLKAGGIEVKVTATRAPGEATEIAREAYSHGVRNSSPSGATALPLKS